MSHTATPAIGGINIYKVRLAGEHGCTVALPKDVCLALGMVPGQAFVAVRAVGPCLVISRATDVSSDEARAAEADGAVAGLIEVWTAKGAAHVPSKGSVGNQREK